MIRFDDNSKLKSDATFGIDGSLVDLTLIKSRSAKAGQFATLVFDQDNGYDAELSLFILLKQNDRINGAGVGLYLQDRNDMKFSQKTFKNKLETIPELRELFMSEVKEVLTSIIHQKAPEYIYDDVNDVTANILDQINLMVV